MSIIFAQPFFFTLRNALIKLLFAFILKFYAMGYAMEVGDFGAPLHCLHEPPAPFRCSPPLVMTMEGGNT